MGFCGDWNTNRRMISVWRSPVLNWRSAVVNWMLPEPRGRPSNAATARWELQATRGMLLLFANDPSIKFPAAPESINATVSRTLPLISKVTAISKLEAELEVALTAAGVRDGRVGQDARRCPSNPQYRHKRCRMRLSLSSSLMRVMPICMGSVAGGAVAMVADESEERGSRRERRELSRRIARVMNCPRVLPSSRQASSDCKSWLRPLRKRSLRSSAFPPPLFVRRVYGTIVHSPPLNLLPDGEKTVVHQPLYHQQDARTHPWSSEWSWRMRGMQRDHLPIWQWPIPTLVRLTMNKRKQCGLSSVGYSVGCWR